MAVIITKTRVLLNPQEKRKKMFNELKTGYKETNDGEVKLGKDGKKLQLTDKERAYRAGYIAAQNDSAKIYKSKHKK